MSPSESWIWENSVEIFIDIAFPDMCCIWGQILPLSRLHLFWLQNTFPSPESSLGP